MELQEEQLIERLIELEKRFQELEKSLEAGSHPWGMIKASQVTGGFKGEKLTKLNITQGQLVDLYQDCPPMLAAVAIKVSLTSQSYREPKVGKICLEKTGNGNYWVIATESENFWLVPKETIKINAQAIRIVEFLFNCEGYQSSQTKEFNLIQAAQVSPNVDGKQWVLEKLGKLDFSNKSVGSSLRAELTQIREEKLKIGLQLKQLNQDFWTLKDELKLIEVQQQEVENLQQQLTIINQERHELNLKVEGLQQQLIISTQERLKLEKKVNQLFELMDKPRAMTPEMLEPKEEEKILEFEPIIDSPVNWQRMELVQTLEEHTDSVRTLVIGCWQEFEGIPIIASGSYDKTINLWNLQTGELIDTSVVGVRVNRLAVSPIAPILVSGSDNSYLQVWDLLNNKTSRLNSYCNRILAVVISPDGQTLVSGGGDQSLNIWNLSSGKLLQSIEEEDSTIRCLVISSDGKILVSSNGNNTIKCWNLDTERLEKRKTLKTDVGLICDLAISPDGKMLACGCQDGLVKILNLNTEEILHKLRGHSKDVYGVAFSPDGETLASGGSDNTVKLWRVKTGELLYSIKGHQSDVYSVVFSPDGQFLVSGGKDKLIKIWKSSNWKISESKVSEEDTVKADNSLLLFPEFGV